MATDIPATKLPNPTDEAEGTDPALQGLKYLKIVVPLLTGLREVGCQRDKAKNRKLFYDDYCKLGLVYLFNPLLRSLRSLQQLSELRQVQQKLGVPRTSLGALSEVVAILDPKPLEGLVGELLRRLVKRDQIGGGHLSQTLTAVDGSVVKTLASLTEAAYLKDKNGQSHSGWRFHTHLEIDRSVPVRMDVTPALNSGKSEEKEHLRARLEADRCYVMDRWYAEFALWNDIVAKGSSYVCRIRDNSNLRKVEEERALTDAARTANVIADKVVRLGTSSKAEARPDHRIRVVLVQTTPHAKRGGRKGKTAGPPSDGILRIATNLLDVPAEVIALIYQKRWLVELFFRTFKHVFGCKHLWSQDPVGIQIQAYLAMIACLLLHLWVGGRPTLRTYEMFCLYLAGWATLEELTAHLERCRAKAAQAANKR